MKGGLGGGLTSPSLTSLTSGPAEESCHTQTILFQAATGEETQQFGQEWPPSPEAVPRN